MQTEDAFRGLVKSPEACTDENIQGIFDLSCPVSGPIVVEGARPGDWVEVYINDIVCGDYGVSILGRRFSAIGDEFSYNRAKVVKIENREIIFNEHHRIPVRPMIGTLGTTPAISAPFSKDPGIYCGNVDCPTIGIGNTVLLPVFVEGAYIYMGDVHAIQGDGEMINPFETPATITLTIKVRNDKSSKGRWPRVMTPDTIETIGVDRDFYQAARIALVEMIHWLVDEYGFAYDDAAYLCGSVVDARPCQIVNSLHSARCVMNLKYLKS